MIRKLLSLLALASLPLVAQAHYLWIESEDTSAARIYFGEFNEGVREKAGGRLDERDALKGHLMRADKATEALRFVKRDDHFASKVEGAGWLLVQDLASEVKDWSKSDIGIVKPMFYARAAVAGKLTPPQPSLTLDIVPDAAKPRELRIFFKQQPLSKAKVIVYAPNLWMQELQSNDSGEVTIATPWPGRYVIDVIHKEREPGEFQGQKYEAVRHRVTFSHVY